MTTRDCMHTSFPVIFFESPDSQTESYETYMKPKPHLNNFQFNPYPDLGKWHLNEQRVPRDHKVSLFRSKSSCLSLVRL